LSEVGAHARAQSKEPEDAVCNHASRVAFFQNKKYSHGGGDLASLEIENKPPDILGFYP
jgi:hypothetical protein